jgi:hypothetical protein
MSTLWRRYWHREWHNTRIEGEVDMGKVESRSEKPEFFAKGGSGKMFGKGTAGKAADGVSGKQSNSPDGGGDKFASGGSGKMFGKGSAGKKVPGVSGKATQEG